MKVLVILGNSSNQVSHSQQCAQLLCLICYRPHWMLNCESYTEKQSRVRNWLLALTLTCYNVLLICLVSYNCEHAALKKNLFAQEWKKWLFWGGWLFWVFPPLLCLWQSFSFLCFLQGFESGFQLSKIGRVTEKMSFIDHFKLDQEILLNAAGRIQRLKMFPYFDIAHYVLVCFHSSLVFFFLQ